MNTLHLEVNRACWWRRVMSFANDATTLDNVQLHAAYLLMESDSPRISARIIAPGATDPLMTWTVADGWKEWRA